MTPTRRDFLGLGVGALAVASLPRALRRKERVVRRRIPVMGTIAEVAVRHRDEAWAQRGIDAAFDRLRHVDRTMSRFRADSDVGRLNAAAGLRDVPVSAETAVVLAAALDWSTASDGLFDPCLGRLSELWDARTRSAPPSAGESIAAGGSASDVLDVSDGFAMIHDPGAAVDLGGIAKGYGVDAAAAALRDHGIFNGLVNVGGDLVALGVDEDGEPWRVGVRAPDHPDGIATVLTVSDRAVATSGDYLRYFEYGGRRYHHLLDPQTGAPRRTSMRSLTVEAAGCMDADAAATALFGAEDPVAERVLARGPHGTRVVYVI